MSSTGSQSANELIDAVRSGDLAAVSARLEAGDDVGARDQDGWNALDWAAGTGHTPVVSALLAAGADPTAIGPEMRRPYEIAVAAGRLEAAGVLATAEDSVSPDYAEMRRWRPYCRAYRLTELTAFPGWDGPEAATDDEVAFVHDDLTVTRYVWPGEDVLRDRVDEEWAAFCRDELGFRVPTDVELVPGATTSEDA